MGGGEPHLRRAAAPDHGHRRRRSSRRSSRSSSSTPASPTTTWTSTTRWSTSTTGTSSWPTAGRSWTPSPGATHGDRHVPPHRGRHLRRHRPGGEPEGPDPRPSTVRRGSRPTGRRTAGGRWSSTTTPRRCPRPTSPRSPPAPRRPPSGSRPCATARPTSPSRTPDHDPSGADDREDVTARRPRTPSRTARPPVPPRRPRRRGGGSRSSQAAVVERLVDAAADEARERGYEGITVRSVARRAGVAPGHRLHLLRLQGPPAGRGPVAAVAGAAGRRPDRRRGRARRIADRRAAGSRSVHGRRPDAGGGVHHRPARQRARRAGSARACSAPSCTPGSPRRSAPTPTQAVLRSLDLAYCGAMLWAGHGPHAASRMSPTRWPTWPGSSSERRPMTDADTVGLRGRATARTTTQIHEDPYPTYARLRAEAPLYRNDESRLLGAVAPRRRPRRLPRTPASCRTASASPSIPPPTGPTPTGPCRSSPWTRRATRACARSSPRPSPLAGWPSSRPRSGPSPSSTSTPPSSAGTSTSSATSPASSPWT